MRYLIFILIIVSFLACDTERDFNKADIYEGTIQVVRIRDGVVTSDKTYNIQVKLSNNKFYRVDEEGNQGCFGDLNKRFDKLHFKSGECACWCDCLPNVDCGGDFLLGDWDIVHESDNRLELELKQVLTEIDGEPYGEWNRYVTLEKE